LANIEKGEHCKNAAFLLKSLVVVDFVVESRILLPKIKQYCNGQLIYVETTTPQRNERHTNLIVTYIRQHSSPRMTYAEQPT
jgi:hypothetical protein